MNNSNTKVDEQIDDAAPVNDCHGCRRQGENCLVCDEDADEDAELADPIFLRNLAERLRHVPVIFGTDDGDIERLYEIANKMERVDEPLEE